MSGSELHYMARALARIEADDPLLHQRIIGSRLKCDRERTLKHEPEKSASKSISDP